MPSGRKSGGWVLGVVIGALLIVALGLIYVSTRIESSEWHHFVRDLGIACAISAFVTVAYERYARYRFDLERIEGVLSSVYGTNIPKRVWDDIKTALIERKVIRKNCEVRLKLLRDPQIDQLILEVDLSYDLASLLSRQQTITVAHGLDEHISESTLNLPYFVDATIGSKGYAINASTAWKSPDGKLSIEGGRASFPVTLEAVETGALIPIRIRRREVRSCPGSYYLIMTELTEDLRVYLDEAPSDIYVQVMTRPTESEFVLDQGSFVVTVDTTLLPGHGIEFKLTRKAANDKARPAILPTEVAHQNSD